MAERAMEALRKGSGQAALAPCAPLIVVPTVKETPSGSETIL